MSIRKKHKLDDLFDEISDAELTEEIRRRCLESEFHLPPDASELSDREIIEECNLRELAPSPPEWPELLEKIWLDFRSKDCPQSLRDYLWNTIGKAI